MTSLKRHTSLIIKALIVNIYLVFVLMFCVSALRFVIEISGYEMILNNDVTSTVLLICSLVIVLITTLLFLEKVWYHLSDDVQNPLLDPWSRGYDLYTTGLWVGGFIIIIAMPLFIVLAPQSLFLWYELLCAYLIWLLLLAWSLFRFTRMFKEEYDVRRGEELVAIADEKRRAARARRKRKQKRGKK